MWSRTHESRLALTVTCTLMIGLSWGATSLKAVEPDDLVKQIEKTLSGVQRRTVTEPSRAEKELIEARKLLAQLKEAAPDHAKLPALAKRSDQLGQKLEKRLGRPIGGTAKNEESKPAPTPQKAPPSDLPSSVTSRLKKIETALSAVVTALEKSQLQTASRRLTEAKKVMEEIQKRYSKNIPAGNAQMKAATERLATIGAQFAKAEAAAAAAAAAEAEVKRQRQAQSQEWIAKFSPFFDSDTGMYLLMGSQFNSVSEAEQQQCRKAYAKANDLMAAYKKTEFPHGKTQELEYLEQRVTGRLIIYNEGEARARQEESCRPWVDKLRQYADVGAGSRKYLVVGVTLSETEINERAALLEEAKALWPEYQKAKFPHGKTPQLLDLEEEMQKRFKEMPEALRQSRALVSGDIEKEFDRILNYLTADTGWQSDVTKKPNLVMERDVTPLQKALERYASTVEPDDAKLATLKQKLTQIRQQDQKNRAIRADRTYMLPDRYKGNDADELRQKVEEIIKEKSATGKALRITLPAEDYKQENVVEWTDTTHTALRYRNTRFMTAQAAAKAADGKVYLHSVHLASDRGSDGSWGPLHGHVMWSDWMAEKNVNKEPPAK
ncbi:MAG: hypothetical protein JSU70_15440 [Phycisphaerales bacterium]|nr:MAG: hypothetical protein JSU70_15440 [Phycisphaerales bacterium]